MAFAEDGSEALQGLTDILGLVVNSEEAAPGFVERMIPVGDCWLQGLEATGEGVVRKSIETRGPGLHHIAFEVDDLRAHLISLEERGVHLIDERPRPGGSGHLVAFAHPRSFGGLLIEFLQTNGDGVSDARHTEPPTSSPSPRGVVC